MAATATHRTITHTAIPTVMTDVAAALKLQSWLSPAFPIGAFSYSHGLEPLIDQGRVTDRAGLVAWLETVLKQGSARVDARHFVASHRAAPDADAAVALNAEARAWLPTAELAQESELQGGAFLNTVLAAWPTDAIEAFAAGLDDRPTLPVAAGFVAGAHNVSLELAAALFLQAFAANVISAGVRLIPLGQTDGQLATAALEPVIAKAAAEAIATPDDLWTATPAHETASMSHETQYARIFRS